jgi:hypothetical protein
MRASRSPHHIRSTTSPGGDSQDLPDRMIRIDLTVLPPRLKQACKLRDRKRIRDGATNRPPSQTSPRMSRSGSIGNGRQRSPLLCRPCWLSCPYPSPGIEARCLQERSRRRTKPSPRERRREWSSSNLSVSSSSAPYRNKDLVSAQHDAAINAQRCPRRR